jgi:hypothetical protein
MRKDWWAPLTGVGFVVVLIIGFIVSGEPPNADEPVQEIVDHYVDNKDAIMVSAGITVAAATLLVFFGSVLSRVLAARAGADSVLPRVAFAGTVLIAVGAGIDQSLSFALADRADDIEPAAVQALQAYWDNDFVPFAIGQALLFLGAGLATVRYRALPVWLGWVAILFGVSAMTPAGFIAFAGGAAWIIVVSILLTLRNRGAAPLGPEPALTGSPPPPP